MSILIIMIVHIKIIRTLFSNIEVNKIVSRLTVIFRENEVI